MKLKKILIIFIVCLMNIFVFAESQTTNSNNKISETETNAKNNKLSPEWLTAFATTVSSVSVFLLIVQISISKKKEKNEYEIKRREKAVEIIMYWHEHLDEKNSLSRKFAETLSKDDLKHITKKEELFLDETEQNKEYLKSIFNIDDSTVSKLKKNNHLCLSSSYSTKLRWQLIEYLNLLEGVLSAWYYKVADEKLIEAEFKYMFEDENSALKDVRELFKNDYPCIDKFEEKMKEKTSVDLPEKDKK